MTKNSARAAMMRAARQAGLVLGLALCASACSTIADLDPTGLLGDSSDNAPASQFPADDTAAPTASTDADVGTTPDLASLPARPAPAAAPDEQAQTAQSLAADGAQARYSADQLRGGTQAAAPPPAAGEHETPAVQQALAAADNPAPTAEAPPQPAVPAAAAPSAEALPQSAAPAAASSGPIVPAATPVQTAALAPGTEPAVPAHRPAPALAHTSDHMPARDGAMTGGSTMSDAQLGFQPSSAPPLDPSINQWVSAPIVARYRQTASNAGIANGSQGVGPAASIAAMNGGVTPTAVVYFPGDGTGLSAAGRAEVGRAAAAFKAEGSHGTVRVVGHASSRTANMPVEKHLEVIFDKSQARADAVAQALIHAGVPASRVLVDAVGDSQPVYYESMPKGEDGNRRAEIFVQG